VEHISWLEVSAFSLEFVAFIGLALEFMWNARRDRRLRRFRRPVCVKEADVHGKSERSFKMFLFGQSPSFFSTYFLAWYMDS